MEGSPERDKRKGKAKVEEADEIYLPPKTNNNAKKREDYYYLKLVGQLPDSFERVTRNLFSVRHKDVQNILGYEDERLKNIHSASGATIGISSDPESRCHHHAYVELMGTLDEVKIAELLIVDTIMETYKPFSPTALMPTSICHHAVSIPLPKVTSVLGFNGNNLMKMEAESGAWIELDAYDLPSAEHPLVRGVSIYGSPPQITNAMNMINKIVSEEPLKPEHVWASFVEEIKRMEEAERQESCMSEDEKQEHVKKDGYGEEIARTENEIQF